MNSAASAIKHKDTIRLSLKEDDSFLKCLLPIVCFLMFNLLTGLQFTEYEIVLTMQKLLMPVVLSCLLLVQAVDSYRNKSFDYDSIFILVLFILLLFGSMTLISDGSLWLFVQKGCYLMAPWFFVIVFGTRSPRRMFKALFYAFCILYFSNLLVVLLTYNQGGLAPDLETYWLYGQRTYMRNILFPAIFFSACNDRLQGRNFGLVTVFMMVASPITLYLVDSMTSLLMCLFIDAMLILLAFEIKISSLFKGVCLLQVVSTILVVFARKIEFLQIFITNVLNRNMTFSGRTVIWDLAIGHIADTPFVGTGFHRIDDNGLVLSATKNVSNAHNMYLDAAFKGGVLSLVLLLALIAKCCVPLVKAKNCWFAYLLGIFVAVFLLEGVVGDIWYPQFFLLLYLAAYLDRWADLFDFN